MKGVNTAMAPSQLLAISALLLLGGLSVSAQPNSKPAGVGMTATVMPNLRLQPAVFMLQDGAVTARVVPEGPDRFLVHARVNGGGNALLEIPVSLSSNVRSFVVKASSDDPITGTVHMLASSDRITVLSSPKPLQSSSIFALGLPAAGHVSASGTLKAAIQIALAGLPKSDSTEVRIRLSISQRETR